MIKGIQQQIAQKVLFKPNFEKLIGKNNVTLRRHWLTDKFPRLVRLNKATLAWHRDEVEQWIDKTILNGEKDAS